MNAQYFIDKLTAIPDSLWTTGTLENSAGQRCVLGHCGARKYDTDVQTAEEHAIRKLFDYLLVSPARVNDRSCGGFQQTTPKARILAALEYIQKNYEN